jgi:hypothetical protein
MTFLTFTNAGSAVYDALQRMEARRLGPYSTHFWLEKVFTIIFNPIASSVMNKGPFIYSMYGEIGYQSTRLAFFLIVDAKFWAILDKIIGLSSGLARPGFQKPCITMGHGALCSNQPEKAISKGSLQG